MRITHNPMDDLKDDLRGLFTGERTVGDSLLAPVAFVAANAVSGLVVAAVVALAIGVLVALFRVRKGQEVQYALGGIVAIGFAAALALRSGRAESFFLPGIVGAVGAGVLALGSVVVGKPLGIYTSKFVRDWPVDWYLRDDVRPAYSKVTVVWGVYLLARGGVQWLLFDQGRPELLAAAKLGTSWPLILPILAATYLWGNRALQRMGGPSVEEFENGAVPPFAGGQRGF